MRKTVAYLRVLTSDLQDTMRRPGVTESLSLNRDPGPHLLYRSAQIEYPDCFRVAEQGAESRTPGRRELVDSEGRPATLNALLQDGLIVARVFAEAGREERLIRSPADLRVCGDTGYGHPDFCPHPCAHCDGTGRVVGFVSACGGGQGGAQDLKCSACDGTGSLTPAKLERMLAGAAMREDRKKRGLSIREEAQRRDITPSALTRLERGELRDESRNLDERRIEMTIKRHHGGPSAAPPSDDAPPPRSMYAAYAARHNEPGGIPDSAPSADTVLSLPLDRVRPLPGYNPRTQFDPAYLNELAESIREKGVLQPVTVRPIQHGPAFGDDPRDFYAIVMGECRVRASRMAGMTTIRALVVPMSEAEHREQAIIENIQRRQLGPIDEARGYQALRDLGMGVTEIALKVGRGQPAVSKSLSLLTLPESAQASLSGGGLSVAQALVIKRYDEYPHVVAKLAEVAVSEKIASHALEGGLPRSVSGGLKQAKQAVEFAYDDAFRQTVCAKQCPFRAYVKDAWGNHLCLRPDHYRELKAQQTRLQKEKDRVAAENARAAGKLPRTSEMSASSYEIVRPASCPDGCTEACPCRGQAIDSCRETITICTDPKRFGALRQAGEQKREEARLAQAGKLDARAAALLAGLAAPPETFEGEARREESLRRCAALALLPAFSGAGANLVTREAAALGLALDLRDYNTYNLGPGHFCGSLARHDPATQVLLVARVIAARQIEGIKKGWGQTATLDWLLSTKRIPPAWEIQSAKGESAEVAAPAEAPPITPAVPSPAPHTGPQGWLCLRCGDPFTPDEDGGWRVLANGVRMTEEGCLHTPLGAAYCADCGPGVTACRECGCTEEAACDAGRIDGEGGCCWTEPDLCSACATRDETPESLAAEVAA